MASYYDAVDIKWAYSGDYLPGKDGDLADTSDDQIKSLVQEIQTVIQSEVNDWQEHPSYAATLSEYIGEPNTKETGKKIKDRVFTSLVTSGVASASDLDVRVVPVSIYAVLIIIKVAVVATPNNSIGQDGKVQIIFVYDSSEQTILPMDILRPASF